MEIFKGINTLSSSTIHLNRPQDTPTSCDDNIFLLGEVEALDALVDFEDGLVGLEARLCDAPLQCCLLAGALRGVLCALQLLQLLLHVRATGCASCQRKKNPLYLELRDKSVVQLKTDCNTSLSKGLACSHC